jgi:uncharacterized membrane protein YcaP (DUF421 family)
MSIDWKSLFVPETPLLEIFIRGSIMYLGLFVLLRFVFKREAGALGISDLLVIVLIADAAQNAMSANYRSITEGLLLVITILFWCQFLDWLGYKIPAMHRILHPPPLPLVKNGELLRRNMRRELVTEEELMTEIRKKGIAQLADVKEAYMEGDGHISVISKKQKE